MGVMKLYNMVRMHFYWPRMMEDCVQYVDECISCKTSKGKPKSMPMKPTKKFN